MKTNDVIITKIKFENQSASLLWHIEGYIYDLMHAAALVPQKVTQVMP